MRQLSQEILNQHIAKIKAEQNLRPILIVFKGFSLDFLKDLLKNKLTDLSLEIAIQELADAKPRLILESIVKLQTLGSTWVWCTYEEYLTITHEILVLYADVNILKNNLYHNTYPCLYTIDEIDFLYEEFFINENLFRETEPEHNQLKIFNQYYGDLKQIDGKYYITYLESGEEIPFYQTESIQLEKREQSAYDDAYLELSEEEDQFLSLIDYLLSRKIDEREIHISFSGELDLFPNNYEERMKILQFLFFDSIRFVLVTKRMEPRDAVDETEYLSILKKYWGYLSFRSLKMYKNINDPHNRKEITLVSQSQIIDDIVKQAKKAYRGDYYNDIFVTSPTGAGKSIMFQIPAIYLAEKYHLMTIVISPLIGLMTDQVHGLHKRNVAISATINSEITPVQKLEIIEKIKEGKISILYISPETLLSRSDIKQLIGERRLGLFVIDEAHIVTTWGKAFRSDYWYLGGYLQKLRKEMRFPIATFTATAIYGGVEDMYAETRDSLSLINPISYFGYVKRDDIEVRIKKKTDYEKSLFREYLHDKYKILLVRLEQFVVRGDKTLVYFPTVSLIANFLSFVHIYGSPQLRMNVVEYYGTLEKERKNANYLRFRNNEALVMLATKAFGMGIDIPDIRNVYHFAPTGNVCDYIQEVGRAARDLDKGYAYFDFLPKDFVHVKRLHGISTIKKYQLVQVIDKILKIMDMNNNRGDARNLLISSDEFRYIFEKKNSGDQKDDFDNKLKTALLIIEKDFKAKMNYSPIIARPRSLFAKEYFMVHKDYEEALTRDYAKYFRLVRKKRKHENNIYESIYICDMKALWEDHYPSMSYPQFKYQFHHSGFGLNFSFLEYLLPVMQIELDLNEKNYQRFKGQLQRYVNIFADQLGSYARDNRYFFVEDLALSFARQIGLNRYFCNNLASVLLQGAENYDRISKENTNFYQNFIRFEEGQNKYSILNSGYSGFLDWILNQTEQLFANDQTIQMSEQSYEIFLAKRNRIFNEKIFILLGIAEAMGLLLFRVNGGDHPEIFIRINSRLQLERVVKHPDRYVNWILNNVYLRHRTSVEMLTYLFENQVSAGQFWDLIEDYFLGKLPDEVAKRVDLIRKK